jgi:hypothetical protein
MFVYSIRASTVKFFAVILLALAALIGALLLPSEVAVYAAANGREIDYGGMKTAEDRLAFIRSFGIEVKEEPLNEESFAMPEDFDRIIADYNQLQKKQGLDLEKYKRKKVTHYEYEVTNYKGDEQVRVNLIIYRNRIIACDLTNAEAGGFVIPLSAVDEEKLIKAPS